MRLISLMTATVGLVAAACIQPAIAEDKSLYERLGGYDAIAAVADDFLGRLEKDEKLGRFFQGVSDDSVIRIRQHVVDLVCAQTGGPCKYTGRDMKTSHAGLGISKEDWERSNMRFGETLAKFNVPEKEQKELAGLLAPLEKLIVDKGS